MGTSSCLLLKHGYSLFSFPFPLMLSMQSVNMISRMTILLRFCSLHTLCFTLSCPFFFLCFWPIILHSSLLACFQCICILWGSFWSLARFLFPSLRHLHIASILATYMDGIIVSRPFSIFFLYLFIVFFDFYTSFFFIILPCKIGFYFRLSSTTITYLPTH